MAITAYPKPAVAITTDQFRDYFRELVGTGALRDADLKPYADSSGLKVKFAAGMAVVDGILVKSTATEERAVDGGSGGGLLRIDTLAASLDFSASPIVQFAVFKGNPASSNPAPPSLALSGSVVFRWAICDIAVSPTASTIAPGDVSDRRTLVRRGLTTWTTATRPANPRKRDVGFNLTLGVFESHDGTDWVPLGVRAQDITDSTAVGRSVLTAADVNAAQAALGGGSVGGAVFAAGSTLTARQSLRIFKGTGYPGMVQDNDLRYRDA